MTNDKQTHNNLPNLLRMIEQITGYFKSYPQDYAVDHIADHIQKFWEPRMRREILEHAAAGGEGLSELAKLAVKKVRV
ncbi:MAG: formate dehydrogenase subunit delta [Candidatus Pacebacteria bacterium]|nr:formate dehydrogenase subunit delta [Candidatus Paceibacterota bacterium]